MDFRIQNQLASGNIVKRVRISNPIDSGEPLTGVLFGGERLKKNDQN